MKDNRLIDGRSVQKRILQEVRDATDELRDAGTNIGKLVSICIGEVPEADVYIRNQERGAEACGIPFERVNWPSDITQADCKAALLEMNDQADVLGVILQRPVPDHINLRSLQSAIHPLKDVEGMNPASIGNIVYNDIALAPCTAAAAVELLRETGLKLEGLEVVMIGHSEIVGKPAAMLLMAAFLQKQPNVALAQSTQRAEAGAGPLQHRAASQGWWGELLTEFHALLDVEEFVGGE